MTSSLNSYDFSKRIAHVVEALREIRGIKQFVLSNALGIDRSNYSRAENGYRPFNIYELKIVADTLKFPVLEIIFLADALSDVYDPLISVDKLAINFIVINKGNKIVDNLTVEELQFLFVKLRRDHIHTCSPKN